MRPLQEVAISLAILAVVVNVIVLALALVEIWRKS